MFLSLFLVFLTTPSVVSAFYDYELHGEIGTHVNDVLKQNNDYKGLDRCAENGKYANQFTIDRRCYVSAEEKQISPYNAVVAIGNTPETKDYTHFESYTTCTGTIVKNKNDGQLYIYSAGHCVSGQPQSAMMQDGRAFPIKNIINEYTKKAGRHFIDYAVFTIPQEYQTTLPYVVTSATFTDTNVDIVGYGVLSILSDNAIKTAKNEWINELQEYKSYGSKEQQDAVKRIAQNVNLVTLFPTDTKLKASFNCNIPKNAAHIDYKNACQIYKKNSGGPIFDANGRLVAVVSTGTLSDDLDSYISIDYDGGQLIAPIDNELKQQTIK